MDDEPNFTASLSRTLRREGYRILTAASAREGLELLARHEVQVVVSDQCMPEMLGTEFLKRVRELHPQAVRIVLSGYTDKDALIHAINEGAIYKFLSKPVTDDQLRATLRQAFREAESQQGKVWGPAEIRPLYAIS